MGEVYRGRDTRLGREVALKVISPKLVGNETSRHRFEREARAASALNHPAIVTIYDVGETDGVSWIAMEWVDGRTLRQVFAEGPVALQDTWSIARQIAAGLAAAHDKGIVHRDLKPENVIIASDGRVRILDFGLARQSVTQGFDSSLMAAETMAAVGATVDGVILGTVGYMSPEQAAGGAVDFRSDQFAFGLLVYEMLAGRRAFAQGSAVETLWATIREDPAPLASLRTGVPAALERVVARCLSKKPEERFASTRDLVAALEGAEAGLLEAPAPTVVLPSEAPVAVRRKTRLRDGAIVTAVILGVTVAAISWRGFKTAPGAIDSLAVLPFENRSTDPESNYLGDELTESLIHQMARVPSLKVMPRATVIRYKGTIDPMKAGRDLRVGAVLTGIVSRRSNDLSVSAELVDTATGASLWNGKYDKPFAELLLVQDTIVSEISGKLRLRLSGDEKRALGGQGTNNPEAYELFLKARHLMANDTEEDDNEARSLFLKAVEKDPDFVEAHAAIVTIHVRSAGNGYAPPKEAWAKAGEQLEKVRRLDPDNFGIRLHMATRSFLYDWDWASAEREFRELSADPRLLFESNYHPAAIFFWARGWTDQAVDLMDRALRVDPGNLESRVMYGDFLFHAGRLDEAIDYYRAIIAVAPDDARPFFGLAEVLKRKGDIAGAISTLRKAYELWGEDYAARALAGARTERDYEAAQLMVAKARLDGLHELARDRYVSPVDFARLYAQIGDREKAFQYLNLALDARTPSVVHLRVDRAWDRIRADPRFTAAVRRVGIP